METTNKKISGEVKYPNQICSFKRKNIVLGIDCQFGLPRDDEPLLQMHTGWSRLVFSIIDKRGESTNVLLANVPAADISAITHKMKLVYDDKFLNRARIVAKLEADKKSRGTGDAELAYSVTFRTGSLKGKTPGEVMLSYPEEGESTLKKQIAFLTEHLKQFPGNQAMIDACNAAINAAKNGTLKEGGNNAPSLSREIYHTPLKYLATRKNDEGKYFVYTMTIACDYTKDSFPWEITIMNGWADVDKKPDGTVNISSKVMGRISSTINLSDDELMYLEGSMERTLQAFELTNFRKQFERAEQISAELRKNKN